MEDEELPAQRYERDLVQKLKVLRHELSLQQPQAGHCRIEVSREEIFEVWAPPAGDTPCPRGGRGCGCCVGRWARCRVSQGQGPRSERQELGTRCPLRGSGVMCAETSAHTTVPPPERFQLCACSFPRARRPPAAPSPGPVPSDTRRGLPVVPSATRRSDGLGRALSFDLRRPGLSQAGPFSGPRSPGNLSRPWAFVGSAAEKIR